MDIMVVVAILAPALPFLMKLGEKAAESAAEKLGEDVWEKANKIWAKLRPQVEAKPLAQGAAQELSENPNNEEARELLAKQLKKFFEKDKALAEEIAQIMQQEIQEGSQDKIQVTATSRDYSEQYVIGKAEAQTQTFGGTHNVKK